MAEESATLRELREYRRRRDSGMAAEGEEEWEDDGELLVEAAKGGELDVVKYLVEEAKAPVEAEDGRKRTSLHLAAKNGHLLVVMYLVEDGKADVEAEDIAKYRALHRAAEKGHLPIVEYLVECGGASIEAEGWYRDRPLHRAAGYDNPSVVQYLLRRCAGSIDVNAQDCKGNTAFHWAACSFRPAGDGAEEERVLEVVRFLVEEGEADPLLRNDDGKRASDLARDRVFPQVEKYLLEAEEMAEMQKQA